jgi:hypothetical protein
LTILRAWLRGEEEGFVQFMPIDELAAIWTDHGDSSVANFDPKSGRTWQVERSYTPFSTRRIESMPTLIR